VSGVVPLQVGLSASSCAVRLEEEGLALFAQDGDGENAEGHGRGSALELAVLCSAVANLELIEAVNAWEVRGTRERGKGRRVSFPSASLLAACSLLRFRERTTAPDQHSSTARRPPHSLPSSLLTSSRQFDHALLSPSSTTTTPPVQS
jgi:hypothetical protein